MYVRRAAEVAAGWRADQLEGGRTQQTRSQQVREVLRVTAWGVPGPAAQMRAEVRL